MFLGIGVTFSVTQTVGSPGGGLRASPKTLVVCRKNPNPDRALRLIDAGAEILEVPRTPVGLDVEVILRELAARDVMHLLIEGGTFHVGNGESLDDRRITGDGHRHALASQVNARGEGFEGVNDRTVVHHGTVDDGLGGKRLDSEVL